MEIIRKAYFGVPKFAGDLFRATRTPSIIVLFALVGMPLAASVYIFVYAQTHHSIRPAELFVIGVAELQVEGNPNVAATLPPNIAKLLHHASEEDKETGKEIFYGFSLVGLGGIVGIIWWISAAFKFLKGRVTS